MKKIKESFIVEMQCDSVPDAGFRLSKIYEFLLNDTGWSGIIAGT